MHKTNEIEDATRRVWQSSEMQRFVPIAVCLLFATQAACGPAGSNTEPSAPAPTSAPEKQMHHDHHAHHDHQGHHGHHGDGPLVHRFDNAEEWAKRFDDPERDAWQKPAEVVTLLELSKGMVVADIGAGTGYFEARLSSAVGPEGQVLAIDVEESMVKYLEERAKREGLTNVKAMKVPFDDPKLAKESVSRVVIVDTWHHIAEREAYSKKLYDALKPGGFVAVVDFTMESPHGPPKEHRLLPEQIQKELASAGLETKLADETLPDQYVVIGTKPASK